MDRYDLMLTPSVAASLLRTLSALGLIEEFLWVMYMTLIQCHYFEGEFYDCLALYYEMEEKAMEVPAHAYSLVISGLCKEIRTFDAMMMFDRMSERGCPLNVAIYTALINSFAKIGNEEQAMRLLQEVKVAGFEPDGVTYGALVSCLSKPVKMDKAMEWFEFCKSNGIMVNAIFYSSLIDGFGKAGKMGEAETLFEKIDGLFKKYNNEEALKLWGRMIDKGITPTSASFRVLSNGVCLTGKFNSAEDRAP